MTVETQREGTNENEVPHVVPRSLRRKTRQKHAPPSQRLLFPEPPVASEPSTVTQVTPAPDTPSVQKQAQALLGILERALPPEDKIQWLLDHFPGRAIVDKQRQKVRMIVRKLVELGVYRTTDAVWNDMRDRRKSRDFSDMDFERAILSHGGYFQAVLRNLTEGHAQNVTKAIELECEKTREVIHSITAQLGRKHPR